jgi:hypothetical protein
MEDEKDKLPKLDLDLSEIMNAMDQLDDPNKKDGNPSGDDDKHQQDDPHQNSLSDSPLYHFANFLKDEGIFADEDLEDYDGTPDGLAAKIMSLADKFAEQKTQNLKPEAKKYLELLNSGLNEEEAFSLTKEAIKIEAITEEKLEDDVSAQKQVITEYLKKTGLSDEDIAEQLEFLEDTDKLYQKSVNYHSKLKGLRAKEEELAKEKAKTEEEQMKKHYEQEVNTIKEKVFELKEVFPGFTPSKEMKEKIFKNITTPAKVENGVPISAIGLKRMKDPVNFEITLNLLDQLGVFDGKFDLLLNAGKKKSVEELENAIKTSDFFNKNRSQTEIDKTKEILDSLGEIPKLKI